MIKLPFGLLTIVPTRSRPQNLTRVVQAWHDTDAFADGAGLLFVGDNDDPQLPAYEKAFYDARPKAAKLWLGIAERWEPLVPKLNRVATRMADNVFALGFAGDDHLPRTVGWVRQYVAALDEMGTGIVHGNDGARGAELPTEWAMTADIVRELGAMVPAPVEHLFCDDAIKRLGQEANCLRYLPDVMIEHMHPLFGKAPGDEQYARVNRPSQYNTDGAVFASWQVRELPVQAQVIRQIKIKNNR